MAAILEDPDQIVENPESRNRSDRGISSLCTADQIHEINIILAVLRPTCGHRIIGVIESPRRYGPVVVPRPAAFGYSSANRFRTANAITMG